jgi:hypothetical protein
LHSLVSESRNIPLNLEHAKMKAIFREFEKLCVMQKVFIITLLRMIS